MAKTTNQFLFGNLMNESVKGTAVDFEHCSFTKWFVSQAGLEPSG
jgi:hypothetical protein